MTHIIEIDAEGIHVRGTAPPAVVPVPRIPANNGDGDVRKKIVPNIKPPAGPSATVWEGGAYVSLREWLGGTQATGAILLQPADDVSALEGKLGSIELISVDFPRIGDGRGYTHAHLLRNRLNYRGRLRALGAVTADQIQAMARVGFDSFALRPDQNAQTAAEALRTFTLGYQGQVVAGASAARREANFTAQVRRLERRLGEIADRFEHAALASSLSLEDMVITDAIARLKLPIAVLTIDTGRLHPETLALIAEVTSRYGLNIDVISPAPVAVSTYVAEHGEDGFYNGLALRKRCCEIRKVDPLKRALWSRGAWITGQRRDQAGTRAALPETEFDEKRGIPKFNPLAGWNWADVLAYAEKHVLPTNALYGKGYVSIGCLPCTKAVRPGEDPRNGRWWWENQGNKECGLHTN